MSYAFLVKQMTLTIRLLATACFVCAQVKVEHPVYLFAETLAKDFGELLVMLLSVNLCLENENERELLWTQILCICMGVTIRYLFNRPAHRPKYPTIAQTIKLTPR